MYIVPIAWLYVVILMSVAEATSSQGTVIGAVFTFLLYGVLPLAVVMYLMGTPLRWRAIKAKAQAEQARQTQAPEPSASAATPDSSGESTTDPVTTMREKP